MQPHIIRCTGFILAFVVLALYALFLATPINLVTADIGRHVMNGNIILDSFDFAQDRQMEGWQGVLNTNFYSYTHPDFEVINHHWGFGVLFALVLQAAGWTGVHLLFILLSMITLMIFLDIGRRVHSLWLTAGLGVMMMPFIVQRLEVRPEVFSYLLIALFLWILIQKKWLWSLPLLEILWVNLHVYFPFGFFLIGIFGLPSFIKKERKEFRHLLKIGVVTALAAVISPFGIKGLLYPFLIFGNYGYKIVENQSVMFLENWGMDLPAFTLLRVWSLLLFIGVIMIVIKKGWQKIPLALFGVTMSILAWLALRNFTLFGFVMIPIGALALNEIWQKVSPKIDVEYRTIVPGVLCALGVIVTCWLSYPMIKQASATAHIGVTPGSDDAAVFIQESELEGPIFNNYDNGGYVIYYLYPEKVFVDNRPEAYPTSFFEDVYIPMQEDDAVWQEQLAEHDFNSIIFFYRDKTPWSQAFLKARVDDNEWAPVFADPQIIIFAKRNEQNQEIIDNHEIDSSIFRWR